MMVRDFNSVIGREGAGPGARTGGPPARRVRVACVGGGSNAIGLFHPFLDDANVALYGVEAGGSGVETGHHAAPLTAGRPGVLHGNRTYLMQDPDGQITPAHSISAGLDYPGVGPEHSWLKDTGRATYVGGERRRGAGVVSRVHAHRRHHSGARIEPCAGVRRAKLAAGMRPDDVIVAGLSGRGDKDIQTTVAAIEGIHL